MDRGQAMSLEERRGLTGDRCVRCSGTEYRKLIIVLDGEPLCEVERCVCCRLDYLVLRGEGEPIR